MSAAAAAAAADEATPEATVILFYSYKETSVEDEKKKQEQDCQGLYGRVLVCAEGLNGTLAGTAAEIETYIEGLCSRVPSLARDDFKFSSHDGAPETLFPDMQVRAVKELISTGGLLSSIPVSETGQGYLSPAEFHLAVSNRGDNTVVLDCRNHKEVMIGHFEGAVDPNTRTWAEWPSYVDHHVEELKGKQVLMYCTGGIRCEKASAFLRRKLADAGDSEAACSVKHLRGGIHKYLEAFPDGGKFMGKNFVFDGRMAMGAPGSETVVGKCFSCEHPHDTVAYDAVCTVCRDPVLVCGECRGRLRELHCENHLHLSACYFTNLDGYSVDELQQQKSGLKAEYDKVAQGKPLRNKRRSLRKQIERIDSILSQETSAISTESSTPMAPPCRSCGTRGCSGACWGFHGRRRLKAEGGKPVPQPADGE